MSTILPKSTEKYYFETVKASNRNEIFQFLNNNFRVEEPLSKAAGMTESDIQSCFDGVLDRSLKNEVSILARSKIDDQIVGCMLNSVWKKEDSKKNEDSKEDFQFGGNRQGVVTIGEILNELHESFWILRPNHNTVLHFEISSVNKNHQRQGLASKFMKWTENENLLKSVNASGIVAEATSLANQILLSSRGYETVASTMLNSRIDSNGNQILVCEDGTERVNLVFKKF
uniref:aralkylamine N-acetyltransferase n=1 Tax=Caenorhabditis tropicalis TaxID=1561998 RepID=A0A1I7UCS1_9PELO